MVSKIIMARFLKLANSKIIEGLDGGRWHGEYKEAALSILRNRGKDISKYLVDENSNAPVNLDNLKQLSKLINLAISKDNKELISYIYSIVGDVENISDLSNDTAEYAISLIKAWKKAHRKDESIVGKKSLRKKKKGCVLSEKHKAIVDAILADNSLTKGNAVIEMFEQGISRTEVISLNFMNKNSVYTLYRDWSGK